MHVTPSPNLYAASWNLYLFIFYYCCWCNLITIRFRRYYTLHSQALTIQNTITSSTYTRFVITKILLHYKPKGKRQNVQRNWIKQDIRRQNKPVVCLNLEDDCIWPMKWRTENSSIHYNWIKKIFPCILSKDQYTNTANE